MTWQNRPRAPALGRKEVHVWRARLDQPSDEVECLRQVLTPDELARANRFHFDEGRRHFTVARGVLRAILSCYSGIEPAEFVTEIQFPVEMA